MDSTAMVSWDLTISIVEALLIRISESREFKCNRRPVANFNNNKNNNECKNTIGDGGSTAL